MKDPISILEAAYDVERGPDAWLEGILAKAAPAIASGLGGMSYIYDASNPAQLRLDKFAFEGLSDEIATHIAHSISLSDPDYVRRAFLSTPGGTSRDVSGWPEQPGVEKVRKEFGIRDFFAINGRNPNGHGCVVMVLLGKEMRLSPRRRDMLTKISCHLAAAHRLRERLAFEDAKSRAPEAILDHRGKVHHAEGEARSKPALLQLQEAVLRNSKARGSLRRQPEQAVEEWKGLIAARWTLLDVSESDGRKYLVAQRNQPRTRGPSFLTDREQQVVAFAVQGYHNKLIAYTLGISHATVRVLMARAAGKLQAHSREELLCRYAKIVDKAT